MTMRSLFYRELPRGDDVAEAIHTIVMANANGLPMAVSKEDVLARLMIMSATRDDEVVEQSASAKRSVEISYRGILADTSIFQSGYERYEANPDYGNHPVVPVTDYFFRYIYSDDVRQCLDVMVEHEIMQSLPKRPSVPLGKDWQVIVEEENNGQPAQKVGRVAGVVIFRNGDSQHNLLRNWISRKGAMALGLADSVTNNLEHARGEKAVENMRANTDDLRKNFRRALPKVKSQTE